MLNQSSIPKPKLDVVGLDKWVHFAFYLVLSALIWYETAENNLSNFKYFIWVFLIPSLYGGLIELIQLTLTSSRSAEWGDWIADITGSMIVYVCLIIYRYRNKKRQKKQAA